MSKKYPDYYMGELKVLYNKKKNDKGSPDEMVDEYNICGKDHYVMNPDYRRANKKITIPCVKCPSDLTATYTNPSAPDKDTLKMMCSPKIDEFFDHQYGANPGNIKLDQFKWTAMSTILDNENYKTTKKNKKHEDTITEWYTNRLSEDVLIQKMNTLNWKPHITDQGIRLKQFKKEISYHKGSSIKCSKNPPNWLLNKMKPLSPEGKKSLKSLKCSGKYFGSTNIIQAEYSDWETHYYRDEKDTAKYKLDTSQLGIINKDFKICINPLVTEPGRYDQSIIKKIKNTHSISDIGPEEIKFIRRKLELLLLDSNKEQLNLCIEKLYDTDIMCKVGLSEKMIKLLNVILTIVDYDIRISDITSEKDKKHLLHIINEFDDLIPRVFKKLIDVSETAEIKHCHNNISTSTQLLKQLYDNLFIPSKKVVNLDLGLPDLISDDKVSPTEFNRITALGMLGIAFLKFF